MRLNGGITVKVKFNPAEDRQQSIADYWRVEELGGAFQNLLTDAQVLQPVNTDIYITYLLHYLLMR